MYIGKVKHDEDKYYVYFSMVEYIIYFFTVSYSYLYIVVGPNIVLYNI